ncbi:Angiopoietin-related protein 1 [Acropora cervicornis]|uniref:Angiopoietin-related protein 1 n=1 Tax=Acropora cervicornis TaxID=6130 RepID=A0AAD9QU50_ACRCE|nr:Angiopoietin-related protein 1 [Acropora cervicornis]
MRSPCVKNLIFCFLLCFLLTQTLGKPCTRQQCTVKEIRCSQEQGSLENYALNGFAFKNTSVSSFKKCFEHCVRDCRCISFNYVNKAATGHDICQLNEENRYLRPNALKQMAGYSYHDIVIDYNVEPGLKCGYCNNGCCRRKECLNDGTCLEVCDVNTKRFQCHCRPGYGGTHCGKEFKSCTDVRSVGHTTDGIHVINPDDIGQPLQVFCSQGSNGGAWVVIQRRLNGSVNFYRKWKDYKEGFGDLNGEFWLGLEKIARLTNQASQKLRVEMKDFEGHSCFVEYDGFVVSGEARGYRLVKLGQYRGSCPNSLVYNIEHGFSTKDRDISGKNCTVLHRGAWWYSSKQNDCTKTNLNGLYTPPHGQLKTGIYWYKTGQVIERLEATQMLLQPLV